MLARPDRLYKTPKTLEELFDAINFIFMPSGSNTFSHFYTANGLREFTSYWNGEALPGKPLPRRENTEDAIHRTWNSMLDLRGTGKSHVYWRKAPYEHEGWVKMRACFMTSEEFFGPRRSEPCMPEEITITRDQVKQSGSPEALAKWDEVFPHDQTFHVEP
jgi:hypothetical protein